MCLTSFISFIALILVSGCGTTEGEQRDGPKNPDGFCASDSNGDFCGEKSPDGCWCDDVCAVYDDCCHDKIEVCGDTPPPSGVSITLNPYQSVNWDTWGQYKANFHTHTNRSDGNYAPAAVIDYYHSKEYDILALTDHNTLTWPWTDFGKNPATLGMLAVRGDEYSSSDHMNAFYNFTNTSSNLKNGIAHVQAGGGLSQINHPGRENPPSNWSYYIPWFRDYPSTVALEVFNQGDRYSQDRKLWDNLNENYFKSEGRLVWGTSNDDMHASSHLYRNFQFMLMPTLTEDNLKTSQKKGTFYFCYEPAGSGEAKVPRIQKIQVDNSKKTIMITASGHQNIVWIGPGTVSVGEGASFNFSDYTDKPFVRAILDGASGDCFTQPFGFETLSTPR